ncbi:WAP four-disulfide core domain protein 8-like [Mya arenaria]|uniref:WAP four-disulfide core domain protein 8-like n=1 Tax=Mya arenaria TaxID=6604 RepID=UPI0022E194C9|nr:WAP four-disulfide core domain protein 8-like [Mya arenaria]
MIATASQITAVILVLIAYIKAEICDLDCGPGQTCRMSRAVCEYPPCPYFPTCIPEKSTENKQGQNEFIKSNVQRHPSLRFLLQSSNSLIHNTRAGECPAPSGTGPCITTCASDSECPFAQKCCSTGCGRTCRPTANNAVEKPGTCARHLESRTFGCRRECSIDTDCPGFQKCCDTQCGAKCSVPCYYWLEPNQRSSRKLALSKLPFFCRI